MFRCPLWAGLKEGREDSGLKGIASVGGEGTSSPSDSRRSSHPASPETRPRRSARVKLPWQGVGAPAGCSGGPRDPDLGAPVRTRGVPAPSPLELFSFQRKEQSESHRVVPVAASSGGQRRRDRLANLCFFTLRPQRGCVRRATANQKSLLPEAEPQRPWRAATRRPRDAVPGTWHQTAASQGSGYSSDFPCGCSSNQKEDEMMKQDRKIQGKPELVETGVEGLRGQTCQECRTARPARAKGQEPGSKTDEHVRERPDGP